MKTKLFTIALIIVSLNLTSCGTTARTTQVATKVIPGAKVERDRSFRSLSKWDYSVEFKDGSRRSATLKVTIKQGVNPMDIAHDAVERLFSNESDQVVFIKVTPHSDMHGLVLNSNSKN